MQSERLILREETEELMNYVFDQNLAYQLAHFGFETEEEIQLHRDKMQRCNTNPYANCVQWDLIEKASKQIIGRAGFHNWIAEHEKAEIGYELFEPYRKKGFMHEACQKIVEYGFKKMRLNRIEAFIGTDNLPSKNLIKSLGFTYEGLLRQHYKKENKIYDSEVYSILKSEFNKK